MRADAKASQALLAIGKAIQATFDKGKWLELGLLTDSDDIISGHSRLLRSLYWGDDDYHGAVLSVLPQVLGVAGRTPIAGLARDLFPNLSAMEDYVGLQAWLADNEPALHEALYAGEGAAVLDELHDASSRLGLPDIEMHAVRIRRGLSDDPAQAIGSAKELLETTLKAVLGLHGTGPETKLDVPVLVKRANIALGLDAAAIDAAEPGAEHRRRVLGSLAHIVNSTAELRNDGFGTGHGISQGPELDVPTARMVVSAAVTVTTFYVEAYAASQGPSEPPDDSEIPF